MRSVLKWIGVLMALALIVAPVLAQDATTYSDPAGRFSLPIPAGWTDDSTAEYGLFTHANGTTVALTALDESDKSAAMDTALELLAPDFVGSDPVQESDLPLPNGIWTQRVYVRGLVGPIAAVLAQTVDDVTYLMVAQSPTQGALVEATPDVNGILLGFQIGEGIDLTDVAARHLGDEDIAEIEAFVLDAMEHYDIPGASLAIVLDGAVLYTAGFGVRELGSTEFVDDDTLFMIGSTTKSMTTLLLAQLVDEGVLDWDTPVTDILPDFALSDPDRAAQIRVRDLVNNASGLPRFDIPLMLQTYTPEQVVAELANVPIVAEMGEQFGYSNLMVATAGFVAAVATGAPLDEADEVYADLLEARIFEPIGMDDTTIDIDEALADNNHAMPTTYNVETGEWEILPIDFERFVTGIAPAGAVWSNAEDMALYLQTQLGGGYTQSGERIVSAENLGVTQTAGIEIMPNSSYGMGWFVDVYNGVPLLQHGGNTAGFTSDFAFLPTKGVGVAVLTNRSLSNSFSAAVREFVFEQVFALEHESAERYAAQEAQLFDIMESMMGDVESDPVGAADVEDYTGTYERGVVFAYESGVFELRAPFVTIPLETTGRGEFVSTGLMAGYEFDFDEDDGDVSVTITPLIDLEGSGQSLRLEKVE